MHFSFVHHLIPKFFDLNKITVSQSKINKSRVYGQNPLQPYQQMKKTVFDFTSNIGENMRKVNVNKYQKDVLKNLSTTQGLKTLNLTNANFAKRRSNGENVMPNPMRQSRQKQLNTRYNIITNQFQNFK